MCPTWRAAGLIAIILVCLPSLAGCVHLELGKRVLSGPDEETVVFDWSEKLKISFFFKTVFASEDSYHQEMENVTLVEPRTKIMQFFVEVKMEEPPFGVSLPEGFPRHVDVRLTMPDGTVWYEETITTTHSEMVEIYTPKDGEWLVEVSAWGYGFPNISFQDWFEISIRCLEP